MTKLLLLLLLIYYVLIHCFLVHPVLYGVVTGDTFWVLGMVYAIDINKGRLRILRETAKLHQVDTVITTIPADLRVFAVSSLLYKKFNIVGRSPNLFIPLLSNFLGNLSNEV